MADESIAEAPSAPRSLRQKIASAFGWRKLPGHAIWIVGVGWKGLDVGGRLDMLSRVTEALGGTTAMLAAVVLSPWTSLGLILTGVTYVVLIGEPSKRVQRHVFWPYLGWSIFTVAFLSMVVVVGGGAIEVYVRKEIAKGIAGVPRATPANPQANPGKPLYSANRSLTPNQQRILISEAGRIHAGFGTLLISYLDTDMEALSYASEIKTSLARAAVKALGPTTQSLNDPSLSGVLIEVSDISNIPPSAKILSQTLLLADIDAKIVEDKTFQGYKAVLFVGPRRIER